jgi:hypothetical protein
MLLLYDRIEFGGGWRMDGMVAKQAEVLAIIRRGADRKEFRIKTLKNLPDIL